MTRGAAIRPRHEPIRRPAGGLRRHRLDSRTMPTTLSKESGVVTGCPSSFTCRPAGFVASVSATVRGRMSRWVVWVSPPESSNRQVDPIPDVGLGLPSRGNSERPAARACGRRDERMGVRVVMEVDPPGERASRQRPVLGIGGRSGIVDDGASAIQRAGGRLRDRSRRRLVRGDGQHRFVAERRCRSRW